MIKLFYKNCIVASKELARYDQSFSKRALII